MDPSLVSLLPAHGICLAGIPFILNASALLNIVIAVSYTVLASVLYCLDRKLKHIPYVGTFLCLWIVFVFLCGLTHLSKMIILYHGGMFYYVDLIVHAMTAIVSAASAAMMVYYKKDIWTALEKYMEADCTECYEQADIKGSKKVTFHKK